MQVKVFEAKDMASGLKMVKEALGPDALILSTRTIRSGKFGMMGKPMMEITAAVDVSAYVGLKRRAMRAHAIRPRRYFPWFQSAPGQLAGRCRPRQ